MNPISKISVRNLCIVSLLVMMGEVYAAKCVFISSYHQGYEWNDGIERGLEKTLKGKCEIKKFYMDTKRHTSVAYGKKKGFAANQFILKSQPDVIIAADDNASRFLVRPYFKDSKIPVVFCGINWTVEEYGYPYSNATGMIEVAPIKQTLKIIRQAIVTPLHGVYLSADVFTEYKDYDRYRDEFSEYGIELESAFVNNIRGWKKAYAKGQKADFIVIANNAGIKDWDKDKVIKFLKTSSKTFTVTNYDWMMPYAMFGLTKQPEEQGEWAGQVALAILDGRKISNIPIVVNRKTNLFVNPSLLEMSGAKLLPYVLQKAIKIGP